MKKIYFIFFLLLGFSFPARADESFASYTLFPRPSEALNQIRLFPRPIPPPAIWGTLYLPTGSPNLLLYNQSGAWQRVDSFWTQTGSNIYPTDFQDPYLKLYIGYTLSAPGLPKSYYIPKLSVDKFFSRSGTEDGGIMAKTTLPDGDPNIFTLPDISDTGTNPQLGPGSYFIWYPIKYALRAGYVGCGDLNWIPGSPCVSTNTEWDEANIGFGSVAFGSTVQASGANSTVSGGSQNTITLNGNFASIGGGVENSIDAQGGAIGGGWGNQILFGANNAFIGGGGHNVADGNTTVIIGGGGPVIADGNSTHSVGGTIGGGRSNFIDTESDNSVILGGQGNRIRTPAGFFSRNSAIGGGLNNDIRDSLYGVIAGGERNHIIMNTSSLMNTIGGGLNNLHVLAASYNTIIGGHINRTNCVAGAICNFNFIGGGDDNENISNYSTIGGGFNNIIHWTGVVTWMSSANFIGGGDNNIMGVDVPMKLAHHAVVVGGETNRDAGNFGFVGGGQNNSIMGDYSVIAGGHDNTLGTRFNPNGDLQSFCWIGGNNIQMNNIWFSSSQTFVWGYSSSVIPPVEISIHFQNGFLIFPGINSAGRVGLGTLTPTQNAKVDVAGDAVITGSVFIANPPVIGGTTQIQRNGAGALSHFDLGEVFATSETVAPGDVLVLDPGKDKRLQKSREPYDRRVIGIASEAPAVLLDGNQTQWGGRIQEWTDKTKVPVALTGRVLCKVSLENGPIEYGDLLTTSSTPGYAMKALDENKAFGSVIGKALEPFNQESKGAPEGLIAILVGLQ